MLVRAAAFASVSVAGFVVAFTVGGIAAGAAWMMIVALATKLLFLGEMFRIGLSGDDERQAEVDARAYFSRHGHWPDEAP
jgi:hypothetical protein